MLSFPNFTVQNSTQSQKSSKLQRIYSQINILNNYCESAAFRSCRLLSILAKSLPIASTCYTVALDVLTDRSWGVHWESECLTMFIHWHHLPKCSPLMLSHTVTCPPRSWKYWQLKLTVLDSALPSHFPFLLHQIFPFSTSLSHAAFFIVLIFSLTVFLFQLS